MDSIEQPVTPPVSESPAGNNKPSLVISEPSPPLSEPGLSVDIAEKAGTIIADNAIQTVNKEAPVHDIPEPGTPVSAGTIPDEDNEWHILLPQLGLGGMALQLAEHCLIKKHSDNNITLSLESGGGTLRTQTTEAALQDALDKYFGNKVSLSIELTESIAETPAQRRIRLREELQQRAEDSIAQDPFVKQLQQQFGGTVLSGSIRPGDK